MAPAPPPETVRATFAGHGASLTCRLVDETRFYHFQLTAVNLAVAAGIKQYTVAHSIRCRFRRRPSRCSCGFVIGVILWPHSGHSRLSPCSNLSAAFRVAARGSNSLLREPKRSLLAQDYRKL